MKYGVIFDMDGVLINSHNMIWESHNRILGRHGVHLNDEEIKRHVGRSLRDNLLDWKSRYNLDLELKSFTEELWTLQSEYLKRMSPDRALIDLLEDLKDKVPIAVGTSSQRFRVDKILESLKLKKYFPIIVSADDVTKHKPEPDLFLKAAELIEMPPERCVVIEDAASGIEAAKRGGMKSVGYENGHNHGDVNAADLIVRSFGSLSYLRLRELFAS